ncbi:TRAP transporter substrate-binding protein DctP [Salinibacterium sp. ZJ454]|uniref:TRAP transporter substrate-binding protein DctP n=1 Tax=Salinibacterium sp. ZJ454 TaxID=2708339 RepID=UPI001421C2F3|nr:TRAP transporter substrate-binding protein DctP [Salinibacterium sp. ZJ454]
MMKTRTAGRGLGAMGLLGAGLLLAGCAGGPTGSAVESPGAATGLEGMDPVVLRVALPTTETATSSLGMKAVADYVREGSDGKIDFEFFYNGTLIPAAESLPGLSSGVADIGLAVNLWAADSVPAGSWVDQLAPSVEAWGFPQVAISNAVQSRFAFENDVIREELAGVNIVPLFASATGPFLMLCADPVEGPEDLRGRSVRVGGEVWGAEVTNLGMSPIFMPGGEVYEGLQRGVLDCAYMDPNSIVALGLMEVAKHLALTDGSLSSGTQLAMNKDVWDALPAAAQQLFFDATIPATVVWAQETMDAYTAVIENAEEMGVTLAPVEELDRLIQQNREVRVNDLLASPPSSLEDPEALHKDFEDVATEWDSLWEEHLGIKRADKSSLAKTIAAFSMGSEAVDWEAFEAAITELLNPVRP